MRLTLANMCPEEVPLEPLLPLVHVRGLEAGTSAVGGRGRRVILLLGAATLDDA